MLLWIIIGSIILVSVGLFIIFSGGNASEPGPSTPSGPSPSGPSPSGPPTGTLRFVSHYPIGSYNVPQGVGYQTSADNKSAILSIYAGQTILLMAGFSAGTNRVELRITPSRPYLIAVTGDFVPSSTQTSAQLSLEKVINSSGSPETFTISLHLNGNNTPSDSVTITTATRTI